MRRPIPRALVVALSLAVASPAALAARFVYEGRLDDAGQPANGRYDLKLTAYGHAAQGATLAAPVTFEGVEVRDGRFRLDVDLPLVKADEVWLEVAVRAAGEPAFAEIPGRAKAIAAPLIGACWSTTGDSGSNPATNFIGTTDAQAFVVRTQNVPSLRIEPSAELFGGNPITANVIAGSSANFITPGVRGATIAGGGVPSGDSDPQFSFEAPNRVTDAYGTVGGGYGNRAGDDAGTTTDSSFATVGGGYSNAASDSSSTVGGGQRNVASGPWSTVGGGYENAASGFRSTVGGGSANVASGSTSAISGGFLNCAGGRYSWAGGTRAKVRPATNPGGADACSGLTYPGGHGDEGTFVWADSQIADFVSTGSNQFLVRAQGGVAINTNTPATGAALTVNGATSLGGNVSVATSGVLSFGSLARQMLNAGVPRASTGSASRPRRNTSARRAGEPSPGSRAVATTTRSSIRAPAARC
jgi:hypothetical protein